MNGFEKMLSKWNFKKIAVIYVTLAVLALIACGVAVGVTVPGADCLCH